MKEATPPPPTEDDSPPVVPCEPTGDGFFRMWCPWCLGWHAHSAVGHQVAACRTPSLYFARGYVLEPRAHPLRRRSG